LDITAVKDNDLYIIELPNFSKFSREYYKVNGVEADQKTVSTNEVPVIEKYKKVDVKVKAKSLVEGLPDLSIEEYNEKIKKLKDQQVWNDYEERVFENLDDEYAYRKFIQSYEIINRTDEELIQTYDVKVVPKLVSDSPYIVLHRHLGENITDQVATYKRWDFILNHLRKYLHQKGFGENDKVMGKTKGEFKIYQYNKGMVNLYLEGTQIFDRKFFDFKDNLNTVKEKMEEDKKWIEEKVDNYIRNTSQTLNVQDAIQKFNHVRKLVMGIDYKVKSRDDYSSALRVIGKYIDELEKTGQSE